MSAAPGTHKYGFMNGRRQVLAGSPGYFAPACGSGAGLGAGSCSEVPGPRSRFTAEWEGAEPGPHPVGRGEPSATPAAGAPAERLCEHHQWLYLGDGSEKRDL